MSPEHGLGPLTTEPSWPISPWVFQAERKLQLLKYLLSTYCMQNSSKLAQSPPVKISNSKAAWGRQTWRSMPVGTQGKVQVQCGSAAARPRGSGLLPEVNFHALSCQAQVLSFVPPWVVTIHPLTWPLHRTVIVCFHRLSGWRNTPSTFILCWHPRISALCVQLCWVLFGIGMYSFPRKDDLLLTKWERYQTGQRPVLLFSPSLDQVSLLTRAPSVSWTKEPGPSRRLPL